MNNLAQDKDESTLKKWRGLNDAIDDVALDSYLSMAEQGEDEPEQQIDPELRLKIDAVLTRIGQNFQDDLVGLAERDDSRQIGIALSLGAFYYSPKNNNPDISDKRDGVLKFKSEIDEAINSGSFQEKLQIVLQVRNWLKVGLLNQEMIN